MNTKIGMVGHPYENVSQKVGRNRLGIISHLSQLIKVRKLRYQVSPKFPGQKQGLSAHVWDLRMFDTISVLFSAQTIKISWICSIFCWLFRWPGSTRQLGTYADTQRDFRCSTLLTMNTKYEYDILLGNLFPIRGTVIFQNRGWVTKIRNFTNTTPIMLRFFLEWLQQGYSRTLERLEPTADMDCMKITKWKHEIELLK